MVASRNRKFLMGWVVVKRCALSSTLEYVYNRQWSAAYPPTYLNMIIGGPLNGGYKLRYRQIQSEDIFCFPKTKYNDSVMVLQADFTFWLPDYKTSL